MERPVKEMELGDKKVQVGSGRQQRIAYLNGIKAFEVAARHLSFAAAAQELNVTPAAVGQQVRHLEEWLGVKLFERATAGASRLSLTPEASKALPEIQLGFEHIVKGLTLLKEVQAGNSLTISVSPSISSKWLMPRIGDFQLHYPDIDVHVDTSLPLADYATLGIDIGIRYGLGSWPGLGAEHLMKDSIFPVCSPDFATKYGLTESQPIVLDGLPLLHDLSVPDSQRYPSWSEWSERCSVSLQAPLSGLKINSFSDVVEAAKRGDGLALARSALAVKELESGELVAPFNPESSCYTSQFCYYVVWRTELERQPNVVSFRKWVKSMVNT